MRFVTPKVWLIAGTEVYWNQVREYLADIGAVEWGTDAASDGEALVEVAGRVCYRSFKEGLNPNVTRIRTGSATYLANILESKHGSVFEHASYTFVFHHVSRVFTHELVRHRAGCAVSQESLRYVRLNDIPIVRTPEMTPEDLDALREEAQSAEQRITELSRRYRLDDPGTSFAVKKKITSRLRRLAPEGLATTIVWTANLRTLRHVLQLRTDPAAEEEIRLVFERVGEMVTDKFPGAFQDFARQSDGRWAPAHVKI